MWVVKGALPLPYKSLLAEAQNPNLQISVPFQGEFPPLHYSLLPLSPADV